MTPDLPLRAASELSGIWSASVQQRNFREILRCMARPGCIGTLHGAEGGHGAWLALLAVLLDHSVTLADPGNLMGDLEWIRLEARQTDPDQARFIVAPADQGISFMPCLGTLASPEFGATIILVGNCVGRGEMRLRLKGPGIALTGELRLKGFSPDWFIRRQEWVTRFPLGVDFILVDEVRVAALPRTTEISGDFLWHM